MSPGIAHKKPKPRLATSVERRDTSCVSPLNQRPLWLTIFLTTSPAIAHLPRRAADSTAVVVVAAVAAALTQSATAAVRLVTSRAIAPTAALEAEAEAAGMVGEGMVVEDLAEVRRRPGGYPFITAMPAFSEVPALRPATVAVV